MTSLIPYFIAGALGVVLFSILVAPGRRALAPFAFVAAAILLPLVAVAQDFGAGALPAVDWTVKLGAIYGAVQVLANLALMFTPPHTIVGKAAKWLLAGPSRYQGAP